MSLITYVFILNFEVLYHPICGQTFKTFIEITKTQRQNIETY